MDKGYWSVDGGGQSISSSDFAHDVRLKISGDFSSLDQEYKYAQWLCEVLNKALEDGFAKV